jgi:acylphosphatase
VNFRAWTRIEAAKLGLDGWVRNEGDGSVEALLTGSPAAVATMMERLHQGPPAARVERVVSEPADGAPVDGGFRILR